MMSSFLIAKEIHEVVQGEMTFFGITCEVGGFDTTIYFNSGGKNFTISFTENMRLNFSSVNEIKIEVPGLDLLKLKAGILYEVASDLPMNFNEKRRIKKVELEDAGHAWVNDSEFSYQYEEIHGLKHYLFYLSTDFVFELLATTYSIGVSTSNDVYQEYINNVFEIKDI